MMSRLVSGPATVGALGEPLDMTLSAVLQHVNVLVDAGLVVTTKKGRTRMVAAAPGALDAARQWIDAHEAAASPATAPAPAPASALADDQGRTRREAPDRAASALDVFFGGPSPAAAPPHPVLDMRTRKASRSA